MYSYNFTFPARRCSQQLNISHCFRIVASNQWSYHSLKEKARAMIILIKGCVKVGWPLYFNHSCPCLYAFWYCHSIYFLEQFVFISVLSIPLASVSIFNIHWSQDLQCWRHYHKIPKTKLEVVLSVMLNWDCRSQSV